MKQIIFLLLFIMGGMFLNASHIPVWFLGGQKPSHPYWKTYAVIAIVVWILMLVLAQTI